MIKKLLCSSELLEKKKKTPQIKMFKNINPQFIFNCNIILYYSLQNSKQSELVDELHGGKQSIKGVLHWLRCLTQCHRLSG